MIVLEAANEVLSLLEQTDQEEYTHDLAMKHINQALFEFSEDNEFKFNNVTSSYTMGVPVSGELQDFWATAPGTYPLTNITSSWSGFSYIKRAWLNVDDEQKPFPEGDLEELLDAYGDNEGEPEGWAFDGEYVWVRPVPALGDYYVTRWRWQKMQDIVSANAEPILLAQAPYAVIYRACQIASVWLLDDNRVPMFKSLSDEAFNRFSLRHSMVFDAPRSMEEFNG